MFTLGCGLGRKGTVKGLRMGDGLQSEEAVGKSALIFSAAFQRAQRLRQHFQ